MRYASIRDLDISNGEGVGISLFTQGCFFHCPNCFNKETWDYNGGQEWTEEIQNHFIEMAKRPYIKRISILGGEPLSNENLEKLLIFVNKIRLLLPSKKIWLYTGYDWGQIRYPIEPNDNTAKRLEIVSKCDVLVDGRYCDELRDITLKFRGSSNQKIIDVKKTIEQDMVILYKGV